MADFGNLFDYNTANGIVIPQTSDVLKKVQDAFIEIFGDGFSTDPTTPNGVLISAIAMMFTDICKINAQNANGMNVSQATGNWLDALGKNVGILRFEGETDEAYRTRIIGSSSSGMGFADSIRNEVGRIKGVKSVVVLDNGMQDPSVLPVDRNGNAEPHSISVPAHSIFVCVRGGVDKAVALAIAHKKSLGCGYTETTEYGTPVVVDYQPYDQETTTPYRAVFYRPSRRYVGVSVKVSTVGYTGSDIVADAKACIAKILDDNETNATVTKEKVLSALAVNAGIVGKTVVFSVGDTESGKIPLEEGAPLVILPYKYISTGETAEEKAQFLADNVEVVVE